MDISSDISVESSGDDVFGDETEPRSKTPTAQKRKKDPPRSSREQPLTDSWLQLPQFKKWPSRRIVKDQKPKPCSERCERMLTCSKTDITRHARSKKHQNQEKLTMPTRQISHILGHTSNDDITTSMKVKICAFIAELNLSLSVSDNIVAFLCSMFPNVVPLKESKTGKAKGQQCSTASAWLRLTSRHGGIVAFEHVQYHH